MAVTEWTKSSFFRRSRHCKDTFEQQSDSNKRNHVCYRQILYVLFGFSKYQLVFIDLIFRFLNSPKCTEILKSPYYILFPILEVAYTRSFTAIGVLGVMHCEYCLFPSGGNRAILLSY